MKREGYPDYEEIQSERKRRTMQEKEGGRQRVMRDMAQGIVERMDSELKMSSFLMYEDPDPRNWTVQSFRNNEVFHEESFWEFPSDLLKAKLMLVRGF